MNRLVSLLAALVAALLPLVPLRPIYTSTSLHVGLGAYEPTAGGIALRYGEWTAEDMLPLAVNPLGNDNFVAVGTTVVVALPEGSSLSVRSTARIRPAWVLVGVEGPDVAPGTAPGATAPMEGDRDRPDPTRSGHRLVHPQALSFDAERLTFDPWEADAPWTKDEARLRRIDQGCAPSEYAIRLARTGDDVVATYGRCRAIWHLPTSDLDSSVRVAIAGEVAGAVFSRSPEGFVHQSSLKWTVLALLLALAILQWLAFGRWASASLGLLCFVLSLWNAPVGCLGWIQLGLVSIVVALVRGCWITSDWIQRRRKGSFWPWFLVTTGSALVCLVWVGVAGDRLLTAQMRAMFTHGTAPAQDSRVLFMGYSTAESVSLPDASFGAAAFMANACPASRQRTATWTHIGATFTWLADQLCSERSPRQARWVVFLGGANDDMSDPKVLSMILMHSLSSVWLRLAAPESSLGAASFEAAGRRQLAKVQQQIDDLQRAQACLSSHRARLLYFHDFLVTDLREGRGESRAGLLEARRHAVEQAGGVFVDLWASFGRQAGVSWFNDFIHPSAFGHQQIARRMCEVLSEAESARTGAE